MDEISTNRKGVICKNNKKKRKILGWRKYYNVNINRQNLFGLPNLGNTCYINSIIQVLIRNRLIKEIMAIDKFCESKDYNYDQTNNLLSILKTLIRLTYENDKKKFNIFSNKIKKNNLLKNIIKIMQKYNDNYDTIIPYDPIIFLRDLFKHITNDHDNTNKFLTNKLSHIFYGELNNTFYCSNCNKVIETFSENFLDINLINIHDKIFSIDLLLSHFLSAEIIENFSCEFCIKNNNVTLKKEITKFPNILILSTKMKSKNFLYKQDIIFNHKNYKLSAVILNDKYNQHYISKIYVNDKFYYFDDMIVTETLDESPYEIVIIFYNLC